MKTDIDKIYSSFRTLLLEESKSLKVAKDEKLNFEVNGSRRVMQGKQEVDGHYFASLAKKPKDVRFYFFPIYTHPHSFVLSPELHKMLKGKSCFHIKKLSTEAEDEFSKMIAAGISLYRKEGRI